MPALRRVIRWVFVATILAFFVFGCCWPIAGIQLRLWRNQPAARRLAESLKPYYPGVDFRGGASYREDVIYISVFGDLDDAGRQDVEKRLRAQIADSSITARLILQYSDDEVEKEID